MCRADFFLFPTQWCLFAHRKCEKKWKFCYVCYENCVREKANFLLWNCRSFPGNFIETKKKSKNRCLVISLFVILCRQRQNGRRVHAVCQSEIPMPCAVAVAVYKNEKKTHTHTTGITKTTADVSKILCNCRWKLSENLRWNDAFSWFLQKFHVMPRVCVCV